MKKLLSLSLVASSLLLADADLDLLKEQMNKQQLIMEQLQDKIEKIEKSSIAKEQEYKTTIADLRESNAKAVPVPVAGKTKGSKNYMPDISLITDFSYVSRNKSDDVSHHYEIPGVSHGYLGSHDHGGHAEKKANSDEGFNFNYAELVMSSEVDPYFNMFATFHLTEESFEIEEAYVTSTILGNGLNVKGGKFLSNFGYLNNQHAHVWSFADMPLVYESFLGSHGINEIGLQLEWVAPTSNYLVFGVEVLQGENEQTFGKTSIGDEASIAGSASAPSLYIGYAKTSFDIDDTTVLAGVSYATGSSRLDHTTDEEGAHAFSGDSKLYGADLVIKHSLDSYSYISLQSEWLMRDMAGDKFTESVAGSGTFDTQAALVKKQAGYYAQLEYAMNSNWKTALRYDNIYKNDVISNGSDTDQPGSLDKYSAMVEYRTSEFAKFRLQYNQNNALFNEDGDREKVNTLILQANFAIGAHGAHSF